MGVLKSFGFGEIEARGTIKESDVLKLRGLLYDDGQVSAEEADAIFRLNDSCPAKDTSWTDFFIEAISDYVVNQSEPRGYITADNAEWLISRIGRDGRVESRTELELLLTVLDKARWSPVGLSRFALEQVKRAVLEGDGPLRTGEKLTPGTIGAAEVDLLRRVLYAFGGDGNVAVTRSEADVLFDINDAVADNGGENPAWSDLFVKAIANVVMASSGYNVPTREEAMRHEAWLESRGELSPLAALSSAVADSLKAVWSGYQEQTAEERALARLERQRVEIITSEEITEGEVAWLAERIGKDGRLTDNEAALIAFLRQESPKIDPALEQLVERLAAAA